MELRCWKAVLAEWACADFRPVWGRRTCHYSTHRVLLYRRRFSARPPTSPLLLAFPLEPVAPQSHRPPSVLRHVPLESGR